MKKKHRKKTIKRIVIASLLVLPFLAYGILLLVIPISRSKEAVRSYVFNEIPMGTSWHDALEIIYDNEWEIDKLDFKHGICINYVGLARFANDDEMINGAEASSKDQIVGVKSMCVYLGEYYGPLHTSVDAYLAFDEEYKLVEVSIRIDKDGP